jgi:uncharacterized protein YggU (UPF0235/DUF167 family)
MCSASDPTGSLPFKPTQGGIRLAVRLTPRASRNGLDGVVNGVDGCPALQLRVAAPPVEGAANEALVAYVASALQLRKSAVRIASGERSRLKILDLSGDADAIAARIVAWIAGSGRNSAPGTPGGKPCR